MTTTVPYSVVTSPFSSAFATAEFGTGYPGWVATPYSVAALLRARTKDDQGNELGYWSDKTRPTLNQVMEYIRLAAGELILCAGYWLPPALWPLSENVIALKAACLIELSYWPEQVNTEQSPYVELKRLYDSESEVLCEAAGAYRPDDLPDPDIGDQDTGTPLYYFGDGWDCCRGTIVVYAPETERTMNWYGKVSEGVLAGYDDHHPPRPIIVNKVS